MAESAQGRLERFVVTDSNGFVWEDSYWTRDAADYWAARYNNETPRGAPHRVARLVELRDDEDIVRKAG